MGQEDIWKNGEGDNWFKRNHGYLVSWQPENDMPLKLLNKYPIIPKKVLEVGCCNGYRLATIAKKHKSLCYGIDPSAEAIEDGKRRYPSINLSVGVASDLHFKDGEFDMVVINFVFHWLARERLLRAVSEIDRILKWEGYLLVGDFLPVSPCKVKYHHISEVETWTYKQNYCEMFTRSNLYNIVGAITGSHLTGKISNKATSDHKTSYFLLQKRAEYAEVKLKPE